MLDEAHWRRRLSRPQIRQSISLYLASRSEARQPCKSRSPTHDCLESDMSLAIPRRALPFPSFMTNPCNSANSSAAKFPR